MEICNFANWKFMYILGNIQAVDVYPKVIVKQ